LLSYNPWLTQCLLALNSWCSRCFVMHSWCFSMPRCCVLLVFFGDSLLCSWCSLMLLCYVLLVLFGGFLLCVLIALWRLLVACYCCFLLIRYLFDLLGLFVTSFYALLVFFFSYSNCYLDEWGGARPRLFVQVWKKNFL
jgi:hypothetical protein